LQGSARLDGIARSLEERTVKYLFALVVAFFLVVGNAPGARAQDEVTFLIPAPTKVVMDKLLPAFEAKTGYKVKVTYGTSMGTRDQVTKGDAFDVPVMRAPYDAALASGNIIASSGTKIASFVAGIGVRKGAPKPDISTPEAVKRMLLEAKSVTYSDPAAGTVGVLTQQMFEKLGISEQMKAKSTIVPNSGPSQASVASGEKELCVAYVSDMRNPGVDVVGPLPSDVANTDDLIGFVSSHATNPKAAKALLDFLSSPEAASFYKEGGMKPGH
jgi:molybdate transport system substrate-binding protein